MNKAYSVGQRHTGINMNCKITFRLESEIIEKVNYEIKNQNITKSDYIRDAIIEKLNKDSQQVTTLKDSIKKISEINFDALFSSINNLSERINLIERISIEHRKFYKETYKFSRAGANISLKSYLKNSGEDEARELMNYEIEKASKYIDENSD